MIEKSSNSLIRANVNVKIFDLNVSVICHSSFAFAKVEKFIATKNLESIQIWGFLDAYSLHYVDLSVSNLTKIESYSFQSCYKLVSISFPPTVKEIGTKIFMDSPNIKTIYYYGQTDFSSIQMFDSISSVKVYVFRYYPATDFGFVPVTYVGYPEIGFLIKISCIANPIFKLDIPILFFIITISTFWQNVSHFYGFYLGKLASNN